MAIHGSFQECTKYRIVYVRPEKSPTISPPGVKTVNHWYISFQPFISCQEQSWTLWSAGSPPSQAVGGLIEDLSAFSPLGLERLFWSWGREGAWASFRRLLRPSFGSSQEDRPQPRQPHPTAQTSVYSCKDNSVTGNADWRNNLI